eukprot:746608_1
MRLIIIHISSPIIHYEQKCFLIGLSVRITSRNSKRMSLILEYMNRILDPKTGTNRYVVHWKCRDQLKNEQMAANAVHSGSIIVLASDNFMEAKPYKSAVNF